MLQSMGTQRIGHDLATEKQQNKLVLKHSLGSVQFSHSVVSNSATPWTAARQAYLSITNSQSLLQIMFIESVMPSNHLTLCHPLLLLPSTFLSIRVFSKESVLHIRWPKYWSFSFSISPSNEYSGLIYFRIDWLISKCLRGEKENESYVQQYFQKCRQN